MSTIVRPHLSHIETYLFKDNRTTHPLDFFIRLDIAGSFRPEDFQAAIDVVLPFHPMLSARVFVDGRRLTWCAADSPQFAGFQLQTAPAQVAPISIRDEMGMRCWYAQSPTGSEVVFQFHHAATDGLGAFGFIEDVLLCYANDGCWPHQEEPRMVARLRERHWCGYEKDSVLGMIRRHARAVFASREFAGRTFVPVKTHMPDAYDSPPSNNYPHFVSHQFSADQTRALNSWARSQSVSVNTVILRDAFVAVDCFRRSLGDYSSSDWLRIAVPGSVRYGKVNDKLPAANLFSMTFPSFDGNQISDHGWLLKQIDECMRASRRDYYFPTFLLALKALVRIPGAIDKAVCASKCLASFLLTNMGSPLSRSSTEFGSAANNRLMQLVNVELIPPMRPHQSISVAVLEYQSKLNITMAYDARIHTKLEAESILSLLAGQLSETIGVPTNEPQTAVSSH